MAIAKATYETVRDAIDRLRAEDRSVTVAAIQQMVGGSNTTITLHKRRYEAEHPTVEAAKTIEVNPRIVQLIAEEIARAVEIATKTALAARDECKLDMERIAEEAAETAISYEVADQCLALAREQVQSLMGQLEQLRADVEQIKVDAGNQVAAAQMRADAEIEKSKLETMRERQEREAAQKALTLAEAQLFDMPKLKQEIEALRNALAAEKDARTESEKSAAVAVAKYEAEASAHAGAREREKALNAKLNDIK
ncbi:MAG: DNA-binding protein [Rhodobacteraceae bacterium]|nr:DNA-binding protein [Paracoccaceae bacterium]